MAETTRKRTGELLRKLFEVLLKQPEGARAHDALEQVAKLIPMTPYEAGYFDSGSRRFEKIIRFASVDCVKAGWLVKQKGTWIVTEEGARAYNAHKDPEVFAKEAARLYSKWRKETKGATPLEDASEADEKENSDDSSSITYEQAEEQAWAEVEKFLKRMHPYDFQDLVADLLRGMGYFVSWVSPPGKDGGVDIVAHPDPLGTQSPRLKVQVKRQAEQKVDRQTVQSFISTISDDDAGLFVSASGFTKDAEDFARSQERRKIMLIDLERLFDLWVQFHNKLDDAARRRFPITPIYFLTPET